MIPEEKMGLAVVIDIADLNRTDSVIEDAKNSLPDFWERFEVIICDIDE